MKRHILILVALWPAALWAQSVAPGARPTPKPELSEAVSAFAVRAPDEGSPFFAVSEAAKAYVNAEARPQQEQLNTVAVYPRVKDSPDSASAMLGRFFTDMFASIKFGKLRGEHSTEKLQVVPGEFSLKDQRELDATYSVRNNTGKILRLDFSTSQRMDMVTRDASGTVVDKWSDDRAFVDQDGIIIVNPKERIQFDESIPTRDMKAGQPYTIQAGITGYPEYDVNRTVTPAP